MTRIAPIQTATAPNHFVISGAGLTKAWQIPHWSSHCIVAIVELRIAKRVDSLLWSLALLTPSVICCHQGTDWCSSKAVISVSGTLLPSQSHQTKLVSNHLTWDFHWRTGLDHPGTMFSFMISRVYTIYKHHEFKMFYKYLTPGLLVRFIVVVWLEIVTVCLSVCQKIIVSWQKMWQEKILRHWNCVWPLWFELRSINHKKVYLHKN